MRSGRYASGATLGWLLLCSHVMGCGRIGYYTSSHFDSTQGANDTVGRTTYEPSWQDSWSDSLNGTDLSENTEMLQPPTSNTLVTRAADGSVGNGDSRQISLSGNGRFVAFVSNATNLVADDTNGVSDVFVCDLATRTTERVSVSSTGAQSNGGSRDAKIASNGRYVVFTSDATNLVGEDTNNVSDVFIYDRQLGTIERVSVGDAAAQANGASFLPVISGDGAAVAFSSDASNLVIGDSNGVTDIFVRRLPEGLTTVVSSNGSLALGNSWSGRAAISDNGAVVSFHSEASNLIPNDSNNRWDVFFRDLGSTSIGRGSVADTGAELNQDSYDAAVSGDGTRVAFMSRATNVVQGVTDGRWHLFLRDRATLQTTLVSQSSSGSLSDDYAGEAVLSADGDKVAFFSLASTLGTPLGAARGRVFVRNVSTGQTMPVPIGPNLEAQAWDPAISANGALVAFLSNSSIISGVDPGGHVQVYVGPSPATP